MEIKDFCEMLCLCTYIFYCLVLFFAFIPELFLCVFKLACWFFFNEVSRLKKIV